MLTCFHHVAGVKNVFQTKDMEYVNVSLPWMSNHYAMVPQLVEKQLKTEQVCLPITSFQKHLKESIGMSNSVEQSL